MIAGNDILYILASIFENRKTVQITANIKENTRFEI